MVKFVKMRIGGQTYDLTSADTVDMITDRGAHYQLLVSSVIDDVTCGEEYDAYECDECGAIISEEQYLESWIVDGRHVCEACLRA